MKASAGAFFILAVALLSAVLGDLVAEGISNANILWHGSYTDRSSLDLLPTSLIAMGVLLATVGSSLLRQAKRTGLSMRSLVLWTADAFPCKDARRNLPAVFAIQMVALYVMESAEQIAVFGHPVGGTLWLGAPVIASLTIHALAAVICAYTLSAALESLADAIRKVVSGILAVYARLAAAPPPIFELSGDTVIVLSPIIVGVRAGRGPPIALR